MFNFELVTSTRTPLDPTRSHYEPEDWERSCPEPGPAPASRGLSHSSTRAHPDARSGHDRQTIHLRTNLDSHRIRCFGGAPAGRLTRSRRVKMLQKVLLFLLRAYQAVLSPALTALFGPMGFGCRFTPTCSQYAAEAIQHHGPGKGILLATRRLCRCHPWGGFGSDPVPEHFASHDRRGNGRRSPRTQPLVVTRHGS